MSAHAQAVHAGEHQVQQDQVRLISHSKGEAVLSVGPLQNGVKPGGLQGQFQQLADRFLVVYDQDRFVGHVSPSFRFYYIMPGAMFQPTSGSFP